MKNITVILIIFLFVACNEAPIDYNVPVNPDLINDYFPLSIGNYWVYDYFEFDEDNEQYPNTIAIDSLVAVDTFDYFGQSGFILQHFRNNELIDSIKIISERDSIYYIIDSVYLKSEYLNDIPLQVLNIRAASWLSINQNDVINDIFLYDKYYQASSSTRLFTNYEGQFSLNVNQINYKAKTYNEVLDIQNLIFDAVNENNETVDVEIFRRQEFKRSFADSIGLVLEIMSPKNIIIREKQNQIQTRELVFKSHGYTLRLRNYFIKSE